jgi:hypothetical protein
VHDDGREILVEAEINRAGRNKVLVNKQRLGRVRDLLGMTDANQKTRAHTHGRHKRKHF